jgi:hypothetical protein
VGYRYLDGVVGMGHPPSAFLVCMRTRLGRPRHVHWCRCVCGVPCPVSRGDLGVRHEPAIVVREILWTAQAADLT